MHALSRLALLSLGEDNNIYGLDFLMIFKMKSLSLSKYFLMLIFDALGVPGILRAKTKLGFMCLGRVVNYRWSIKKAIVGSWWWSSGQLSCLLIQRTEFDLCRLLNVTAYRYSPKRQIIEKRYLPTLKRIFLKAVQVKDQ